MYGLEQTPINVHGSDKNGGTVIYKINSVSVLRNPTEYEQALIRGAGLFSSNIHAAVIRIESAGYRLREHRDLIVPQQNQAPPPSVRRPRGRPKIRKTEVSIYIDS